MSLFPIVLMMGMIKGTSFDIQGKLQDMVVFVWMVFFVVGAVNPHDIPDM